MLYSRAIVVFVIIAVFAAALLPLAGCERGAASKTGGKAAQAQTEIRVRTARPEVRGISNVLSFTGTLKPVLEVRISPEVPGKIKKIHKKEGDGVRKGETLITFDTKLSALQKKQAATAVAMAKVQVASIEKEVNRLRPLVESGAISKGEFDKVQAGYDAATAALAQARAAESLSSYTLQVSTIKAPFAGVVARKLVNEGEVVAPGMLGPYGMITLMDLSTVVLQVGVGEKDLPSVVKGQEASVRVDAYPGEVFAGTVENISPAADPVSRLFPVDIHVPNPGAKLKSGMFAKVGVLIETKAGAVVVPLKAVVEEGGKQFVFVVEPGGVAKKAGVTTGIQFEGLVEITGGLADAAKEVVVEGNFGLRDGAKVKAIR